MGTHRMKMHRMASVAALAAALSAGHAMAQSGESAATTTDTQADSGEIIVTAQRREQTLQDVPVAVSAIGAEQLQARRLFNIDQLSGIAPNLTILPSNTTSSAIQVAIRGSVTTNPSIVYDPAVGIYLDGIYVGKGSGAVFDVGDLERVEVLRGPQGTLFGRNTLAGAVSFVTRKPSDQLRVEGEASYGNYDYLTARGLVNLPLTDTLFIKVSGQFQKRDGFTRAVPDPLGVFKTQNGDVDDRDRDSILAQIRWTPTPDLTIDYAYDLSHTDEHPLNTIVGIGKGNIFDPTSPIYSGIPAAAYVVPGQNRPKQVSLDKRSSDKSRIFGHALTIDYDLGGANLKSITAYRDVQVDEGPLDLEVDGTPIPIALGGYNVDFWQFSQELQITGSAFDKRLNYVAGAYYLRDNGQSPNPQSYFFGSNAFDTSFGIRTRALAVYGQADYRLTGGLTLTGGLRWTQERKQVNRFYQILALSPNPGLPLPFTTINITKADDVHRTFSNVSPTAILAYEFNRDLNVYAKYAVGFRSGSFNGEATSDAEVRTSYRPEQNRSYELGLKSRFFDRRLQVNIAAFLNQQKDKQVPVFLPANTAATINRNAGRARVYGLEVEVDARPVDALHLYGSIGLLRTKFLEYLDTSNTGTQVDVADNRYFQKAPRTTATGGADLKLVDDTNRGTVTLGGDVQYQAKSFSLPGQLVYDPAFPLVAPGSETQIRSSTIVNGRIRWDNVPLHIGGAKVFAMLWANNLTNYRKINNKISFGPNFGGLVIANYTQPRTYGVTLGFKY